MLTDLELIKIILVHPVNIEKGQYQATFLSSKFVATSLLIKIIHIQCKETFVDTGAAVETPQEIT